MINSSQRPGSKAASGFWARFGSSAHRADKERYSLIVAVMVVGAIALVIVLMSITIALGRTPLGEETLPKVIPPASASSTPTASYASPSPTFSSFKPVPMKTGVPQLYRPVPSRTPTPTQTAPPKPAEAPRPAENDPSVIVVEVQPG